MIARSAEIGLIHGERNARWQLADALQVVSNSSLAKRVTDSERDDVESRAVGNCELLEEVIPQWSAVKENILRLIRDGWRLRQIALALLSQDSQNAHIVVSDLFCNTLSSRYLLTDCMIMRVSLSLYKLAVVLANAACVINFIVGPPDVLPWIYLVFMTVIYVGLLMFCRFLERFEFLDNSKPRINRLSAAGPLFTFVDDRCGRPMGRVMRAILLIAFPSFFVFFSGFLVVSCLHSTPGRIL